LAAIREERQAQERLLATGGYGPEPTGDKIATPIERKMDRLSDKAAIEEQSTAAQKARLDRIAWLTKCEAQIGAKVKP
jgi:hypothetical protein